MLAAQDDIKLNLIVAGASILLFEIDLLCVFSFLFTHRITPLGVKVSVKPQFVDIYNGTTERANKLIKVDILKLSHQIGGNLVSGASAARIVGFIIPQNSSDIYEKIITHLMKHPKFYE